MATVSVDSERLKCDLVLFCRALKALVDEERSSITEVRIRKSQGFVWMDVYRRHNKIILSFEPHHPEKWIEEFRVLGIPVHGDEFCSINRSVSVGFKILSWVILSVLGATALVIAYAYLRLHQH